MFNIEISEAIKEVIDKTMAIKDKLLKNEWTRETEEGYLTHRIEDYFACFRSIDKEKLDHLLNEDL